MSLATLFSVIILLVFAGFLAGSESALTSLSRLLIEQVIDAKPKYANKFSRFTENPARYLNVLLLVRKSCELTATVLVAAAFIEITDNKAVALTQTIVLMVAISYVIVGVGPRTLGKQNALSWSKPAIITADLLSKLLSPLTNLLITVGNAITPGKGFKSGPFSTEAEFRDLVDQASESGFVEESEREMIHSVFDLGETMVRELMVPRTEMVWIESGKNLRQGLSLALRSGFTRIPVISENLDNVVGIAYVKDLARRVHENHDDSFLCQLLGASPSFGSHQASSALPNALSTSDHCGSLRLTKRLWWCNYFLRCHHHCPFHGWDSVATIARFSWRNSSDRCGGLPLCR